MSKLKTTRNERKLLWATKEPTALGLCIKEFAKLSNAEKEKDIKEIYAYTLPYNFKDLIEGDKDEKVTIPPHLNEVLFTGIEALYTDNGEYIKDSLVELNKPIMEDLILRLYKYYKKNNYNICENKNIGKNNEIGQHGMLHGMIGSVKQRNKIKYNNRHNSLFLEGGLVDNYGQNHFYSFTNYLILAHFLTSEKLREEFEDPFYIKLIKRMDNSMKHFTGLTAKRKHSFDSMTQTEPDMLKELRKLRKTSLKNSTEDVIFETSSEKKAKSLVHNLKEKENEVLIQDEYFIRNRLRNYNTKETDVGFRTCKTWVIKTKKNSIKIILRPDYTPTISIEEACEKLKNANKDVVNFNDDLTSEQKLIIKAVLLKEKEAA